MPDQNADRRAELIAAALVGELTEAEAAEFERMRASDPTIDAELVQLQGLTGNISGLPDWMEASPSEELRERCWGSRRINAPATAVAAPTAPATQATLRASRRCVGRASGPACSSESPRRAS